MMASFQTSIPRACGANLNPTISQVCFIGKKVMIESLNKYLHFSWDVHRAQRLLPSNVTRLIRSRAGRPEVCKNTITPTNLIIARKLEVPYMFVLPRQKIERDRSNTWDIKGPEMRGYCLIIPFPQRGAEYPDTRSLLLSLTDLVMGFKVDSLGSPRFRKL